MVSRIGINPSLITFEDSNKKLFSCRYDFFIVSQFVNQGTVSPTSYNVIHDTLGLDPDKIQRLTFKMTHCYYNWSVSINYVKN